MPGYGPYKDKKAGRWYGIKEDARGKRRRKTGSKAEVRRWLAEDAMALSSGAYRNPAKITFCEYAGDWRSLHKSDYRASTWRDYCSVLSKWLLPALGGLRFDQIDTAAINLNVRKPMIRAGLSRRRQQIVMVVLNRVLQEAVADGLLYQNPANSLPRPSSRGEWSKEPIYIDPEQIFSRLFDTAPFRDLPAIALGVLAGLRASETWGLPRACAEAAVDTGVLQVRQKLVWTHGTEFQEAFRLEPPKGRLATREVAACDELRSILAVWLTAAAENELGLLFCSMRGTPLRHDNWRCRRFHKICKRGGFVDPKGEPALRYHDLRHTFAMLRIFEGADLLEVQRDLGHASITTTERYARLQWDPRRDRDTSLSDLVFGGVEDFGRWLAERKSGRIAEVSSENGKREPMATYTPKRLRMLKKSKSA